LLQSKKRFPAERISVAILSSITAAKPHLGLAGQAQQQKQIPQKTAVIEIHDF
jgi:hypothetical protein